jgi:hypothetical protein
MKKQTPSRAIIELMWLSRAGLLQVRDAIDRILAEEDNARAWDANMRTWDAGQVVDLPWVEAHVSCLTKRQTERFISYRAKPCGLSWQVMAMSTGGSIYFFVQSKRRWLRKV